MSSVTSQVQREECSRGKQHLKRWQAWKWIMLASQTEAETQKERYIPIIGI